MPDIGHASLPIIPSFKGIESNLERGLVGPLGSAGTAGGTKFGDAAGKSAGQRFKSVFSTAAKASLLGLAGAGFAAFKLGKDSIQAASDLEESTNKVSQVFGKSADQIFKFSAKAADALGQTNEQARSSAATFGIFGKAAKLSDRDAAKFSKRMVTLASDLASFNNTDPAQAAEALGAALRGESEPIRAYGVLLDEATLKAEALALGILKPVKDSSKIQSYQVAVTEGQKKFNEAVKESGAKSLEALKAEAALGTARDRLTKATEGTIPPLTQQQKLLAAQSQIFKQTEVAQGDFARTSDGLANQQRRLSARFEDTKAKLGKGLLPIMNDAAGFILDKGIPAFEKFATFFNDEGIPAIKKFGEEAEPVAKEILPALKSTVEAIGDGLKFAAPYAKDLVKAFNDMPEWAKTALITGGVGAFALNKVKGSSAANAFLGGNRGGSLDKPLFVTVVGGRGPGGPVVIPDENDKKNPKNKRNSRLAKGGIVAALLATGLPVPEEVGDLLGKIPDGANDGLLGGALAKLLGASNPVAGAAAYGLAGKDAVKTDFGLLFGSDEENLKKALDEFGLSYKKLTADLTAFGNEGEYVAKVMKRLKDESSGFKKFGAVLNPFDSNDTLAFSAKNTIEKNPLYDSGLSMWEQVVSQFATEVPDGFKPGPGSMKYLAKLPLEARIDVLTPGLIDSRKDVIDLTQRVDGLGRKDIKPLVKLLGIETAESSVDRLAKKIDNLNAAQFATNNINNAIDAAQERLRAAGINVNVENMHVADGRDMVKQADRKRRRAELDGVRSW